jgi:hypothetical protein
MRGRKIDVEKFYLSIFKEKILKKNQILRDRPGVIRCNN